MNPLFRRLAELHRELGEVYDQIALGDGAPRTPRKAPVRQPPKFTVVPNELQREKADRLLRAKGLAK